MIPVPTDGPYVQINSGHEHACAIRGDGTMSCWGWDRTGGYLEPPPYCPRILREAVAPAGVVEPPVELTFTDVAAGDQFTCGTVEEDPTQPYSGEVICWGYYFGEYYYPEDCGINNVNVQGGNLQPIQELPPTIGDLGAGQVQYCYVEDEGTTDVYCNARCDDDRYISPGFEADSVDLVSGGYTDTCFLLDGYYVDCRGMEGAGYYVPDLSVISTGGCFVTGIDAADGTLFFRDWGQWDDPACVPEDFNALDCDYD
jgi:hypothetical protein